MRGYQSDSMRDLEAPPSRLLIWSTLLLAMILNLVPYPDGWFAYKPDFMALLIVFWLFRARQAIGYTAAFGLGLLTDVAYTSTLGQHSFAYAVLVLVADLLRNPYVIAGRLQQCVFVTIALGAALAASLGVSVVFDDAVASTGDLLPALIGGLLWLLLPMILRPAYHWTAPRR